MRFASFIVKLMLLAGPPDKNAVLSLPVTARAGAEVWPLQPEHMEATCDGRPLPPNALRRIDAPISIGLVLQPTTYLHEHIADVQAAIRVFLGQIRPGDELFTVNSLERPALGVGFTSDPGAIVSSVALPDIKRRPHLYQGMDFALGYLENARNLNRALLVILAGDDAGSVTAAEAVKARTLTAHVPTYVVSLHVRKPDELTEIAIDSGGEIWEVPNSNQLPEVMNEVRIRPGYLLDLHPAEQCRPADTHVLMLRCNPGVAHNGVSLHYQHKVPAH